MLAIRMRRLGAKKRPFFRVVVIDSHAARDGRALEVLGHYNPTTVPETFHLNHQRLDHWLTRGAQPSSTLRTLLTRHPEGEAPVEVTSAASARPVIPATPVAPAGPAAQPPAAEVPAPAVEVETAAPETAAAETAETAETETEKTTETAQLAETAETPSGETKES